MIKKNIQKLEMEGNYKTLINDLDTREKYIVHLEAQLLRLDYQYGVIVKDLKQKFSKLGEQFNNSNVKLKQFKRENKKLHVLIQTKQKQNQQLATKLEEASIKAAFNDEGIRRTKEEIQMLRNEIKYLEGNQAKNESKLLQTNKKKQQYKDQCMKLKQKVESLQKQTKRMALKNKQLEQLVQKQIKETHHKIHNIGMQLLVKNTFQETKKIRNEQDDFLNMNHHSHLNTSGNLQLNTNFNETISKNLKPKLKSNNQQQINDWETDMKKLKNCIDYGSSYIVVFDPMNLDRMVSRQIFKFFKKCFQEKQTMQNQLQNLKIANEKIINQHKQTLKHFQQQIYKIAYQKNKRLTIETQMQTQTNNGPQAQKTVNHLLQLNTKLKMKNNLLIQCLEIMGLRSIVLSNMLQNSHINMKHMQQQNRKLQELKLQMGNSEQRKYKQKRHPKLRSIFYVIFFSQILIKKQKQDSKLLRNDKYKIGKRKICLQIKKLQKQGIKNVQLQKLKDCILIDSEQIHGKVQQIISYYQFRFKEIMPQNSIYRQLSI